MNYTERLLECDNLEDLFDLWKHKQPSQISYVEEKNEVSRTVDHQKDYFIADGIVDKETWDKCDKKILFVLKEAYGTDWGDLTLATWLQRCHPKSRIWKRIARWSYGIHNTDADSVARYVPELTDDQHKEYLNRIAVMNIKKSGGKSKSNYSEISAYAQLDREEIKKEFSIIDADVVVCGATFKTLLCDVFESEPLNEKTSCDNWYYFMNLDGKERLYIDSYHPANMWPDLMNYYMITSIYQQALKDPKNQ